jgi:NMD protein affecting ribosome stability and mRNA decay
MLCRKCGKPIDLELPPPDMCRVCRRKEQINRKVSGHEISLLYAPQVSLAAS